MSVHEVIVWKDETNFWRIKEPLLRNIVSWREGGCCFYCGSILREGWHLDHVWPRSRGGSNSLSNYVASCQFCNCSKHATIRRDALLIQTQLAAFESALVEEWMEVDDAVDEA